MLLSHGIKAVTAVTAFVGVWMKAMCLKRWHKVLLLRA